MNQLDQALAREAELIARLEQVEARRDELLNALKAMTWRFAEAHDGEPSASHVAMLTIARTAIENAKGGAA